MEDDISEKGSTVLVTERAIDCQQKIRPLEVYGRTYNGLRPKVSLAGAAKGDPPPVV